MARRPFGLRRRNALTASVSVVDTSKQLLRRARKSPDADWQKDAWQFYHDLGEVRYAAKYVANALAGCRFFIGTKDHPGAPIVPVPDDGPPADLAVRDLLQRVKGRDGTFQSLVRTYGVQQFVSGESWLVAQDGVEGELWEFLSTAEKKEMDQQNKPVGEDDSPAEAKFIARFWQRDPEYRNRADSPLRPLLDICDALRTALATWTATDKSRLAMAGVWFIPSEGDLPKVKTGQEAGTGPARDHLQLLDDILEAMAAAIEDPSSAAALVPILVEMKAEFIEKVRPIIQSREIDQKVVDRIEHLIRRMAQGLDIPAEILLGLGGVNHWGAWQITEEAVNSHVAPLAAAFCEDLTVGVLKTNLLAMADEPGAAKLDMDRYAVWFDTTDLITSPDRDKNALELYDRGLLAGEPTVEALGFDPSLMPDEEEFAHWLEIQKALKGAQAPPDENNPDGGDGDGNGPPNEGDAPDAPDAGGNPPGKADSNGKGGPAKGDAAKTAARIGRYRRDPALRR